MTGPNTNPPFAPPPNGGATPLRWPEPVVAKVTAFLERGIECAIMPSDMADTQPVVARGVENLRFKDPAADRTGPIAWQMHNAGLFDEFKDVRIEVNTTEDRLLLVEDRP